ncbi:MAG: tripartite tricarboxylate transporter permease [Hyphomicrobiales bacterium]|nr:tripartite tricarboxylate transporter permease [Hyphomicrobiales bacterium]MCP5373742.1 tripartite tricarboxylate transporter permease [Hyphomicrobiales bacterium]
MEFLGYFGAVFTPMSMLILCVGTVGGLILGATPGLSPTMAVALLIPFTFHMDPAQGLILLGAAYTSSVAGGAVSAILLNIPGAPANIATSLDGFQMAKKGEAAKALQMGFISSGVGGVFGILVLIFLTPVLAKWALGFGPSHLFWIAILGVTIIGTLDTRSVVKGLLSGCIGLWIATIGYDSIQGVERFIFTDHLEGGVHVIAALIGLFAIPQVVEMLEHGRTPRTVTLMAMEHHSVLDSARQVFAKGRALTIGSIVGTIIGLIPGAGGQIAGIVSYDQTRKFSPNRARFGSGEAEGVVAAETANNAMVGPSLVPLLTLSVPGSPTAAVLLGGLLIHGIFPGPNLFTQHAPVAWTFINSMLVGQILMMVFGLYIARLASRVTLVPQPILAAGILVLAVFGSYSVQSSLSDVFVMLTLGVGMYFLARFGFSAAPMVLGIILGPIAESNYVQGRIIAEAGDGLFAYFCTGTLNLVLIAICAASVIYSVVMEVRTRRLIAQLQKTAQQEAAT